MSGATAFLHRLGLLKCNVKRGKKGFLRSFNHFFTGCLLSLKGKMTKMSLYVVFFYIFLISGGFAMNENITRDVELRESHVREKRFWPLLLNIVGAIGGAVSAATSIASVVLDSKKKGEDTKVVVINNSDDSKVKEAAEKFGSPEKVSDRFYKVKTTSDAVSCNSDFCRKLGRFGEAAFSSPCSPEFCHCDTGDRAWLKVCGPGTVFNPIYRVCDWPRNTPGC